ncbi:hypothetical protein QM012_001834 [Aureobasidium pullulans]|uniref:C2H2-type domain-containing protein n=1 Tax=Aureobasidium pullulans TaxID=5580 RepID=A0ABR0TE38_AURPU
MRRPDQHPVNSANHHPGLPSEEHDNQSNLSYQSNPPQVPSQYGTNYPWMSENLAPLSEPLTGIELWDNSMVATSSPYFPNAMDMSAFQSSAMQDHQASYIDSPAITPGIAYEQPLSTGSASPFQNQSTNAAMTANSQEMQNWFAQSARRDSRSRKGFPRRRSLYSRNSGLPISIPKQQNNDWSTLDPLQRWQNSPPENEPASLSAINHAVASTDLDRHLTVSSANSSRVSTPGIEIQGFGYAARRTSRPASISSLESGTSNGSMDSILSGRSGNSRISASSSHRNNARGKVTKSRARPGTGSDDRPFQCTFCCDTFKNKFDWCRHEKSLHLNPEQWVCTPDGEVVTCPSSGDLLCAYCLVHQPSKEHLESHNSTACAYKSIESRSFKRKDHLIQHLRLVHKVDIIPAIGEWKPPELPIKSRCGFCSTEMSDWKARADHLSKHFREGKKMLDWRGTHGFEPHVAQQVTNSMPPFLIGSESKTPVPFSATKPGHSELLAQISSRAALNDTANNGNNVVADPSPSPDNRPIDNNQQFKTAWEILTFHLGRFAQEKIKAGIIPTDEMFQQESRRLWFDSDDPWNQTFADDTQWMEIFRQEHGLNGGGNTPDTT